MAAQVGTTVPLYHALRAGASSASIMLSRFLRLYQQSMTIKCQVIMILCLLCNDFSSINCMIAHGGPLFGMYYRCLL